MGSKLRPGRDGGPIVQLDDEQLSDFAAEQRELELAAVASFGGAADPTRMRALSLRNPLVSDMRLRDELALRIIQGYAQNPEQGLTTVELRRAYDLADETLRLRAGERLVASYPIPR